MKTTIIGFILFVLFYNNIFAQCTVQPAIQLVDPSDSIACGNVFTLLNAQSPAYGYGYWKDIEPNTIFSPSPTSPNPIATIDTIGINDFCYHHFYWITVYMTCRDTSSVVKVKFVKVPTINAGADTSVIGLTTTFHATWDSVGIGYWYCLNSGNDSVVDEHSPTTSVNVTQAGTYIFVWQVNNLGCVASDTVQITFNTSYTQLNSIKNLYFYPWYDCPNNYFQLKWSPPDSSTTDTLVGYNIYRNNVLYRFQTDTTMHHLIPQDTNCSDNFLGGDGVVFPPFYIHVTAVYNLSHIESLYNDSALCMGLALNTKEIQDNNIKIEISPNPFLDYVILKGQLKNQEDISFVLLNNLGQTIKCYPIKSFAQGEFTFSLSAPELSKGMYYLKIIVGQKVYFKKLSKL